MDIIRWLFFLSLALLLIASCNNASAQFKQAQLRAEREAIHQSVDGLPA